MKKFLSVLSVLLISVTASFAQYADKHDDLYNVKNEHWPYVNEDNVRVRTIPSTDYSEIITKYNSGTKVNVIGYCYNEKNELWYSIRIGQRKYGWMFGEYISFTDHYPESKIDNSKHEYGSEYLEYFIKQMDRAIGNDSENGMASVLQNKPVKKHVDWNTGSWYGIKNARVYDIDGIEVTVDNRYYWRQTDIRVDFDNTFGIRMGTSADYIERIFQDKCKDGKCFFGTTDYFLTFYFSNRKLVRICFEYNDVF